MSVAELDIAPPSSADHRLDQMLVLLQSMDARLSRLEARVAEREPVAATDRVVPTDAGGSGVVSIDGRLSTALSEPRTVDAMVRILERLDHIDQSLLAMAQLPDLAAGAVDTVDRLVTAARDSDLAVDARLQATVALVERFSDPDTVEAVLALTENLDQLVAVSSAVQPLMQSVAQLPDVAAVGMDTVRRLIAQMDEEGLELEYRLQGAIAVTGAVTQPRVLAALERLLEDPALLEQVADLADEASTAVAGVLAQPESVGPVGAFRALYDPHVQRGLGVAIALARVLGKRLERA